MEGLITQFVGGLILSVFVAIICSILAAVFGGTFVGWFLVVSFAFLIGDAR